MPDQGPQGRGEVADLLRRHGIRPRRRLGQHFLADPNLVRKVVELVDAPAGSRVLEVGAGTGTLTRALAEAGYRVLAYEIDRRLEPVLEETVGHLEGVEVRIEDALEADLPGALGEERWTMAANLPYNVGTPLLLGLLREAPQVVRLVVMVQREVADRLVAGPGGKTYGIPSVVTGLYARAEVAFRVPAQVFLPTPRVESAVVLMERRAGPSPDRERAAGLAGVAFGQRRKMLRSSLAGEWDDPEAVLARAGVDPEARAETVPPEAYLSLARAELEEP